MTSYGDDQIIYDAIGNPLLYRGGMQFEWSHGRRLEKASNSSYNVSYKYDDGGIRTSKTINGTTTQFITSGIQMLAQKAGNNVLIWQIDGNGATVGLSYNSTQYLYPKNAQGDIAGITDSSGNIVAEYVYDSWGKVLHVLDANGTEITDSNNIALINPLRYRGYYYDSELGLYYLNACYYDPETARFINADDGSILLVENKKILDYNLFSYCHNDPVMLTDYNGKYSFREEWWGIRVWLKNNEIAEHINVLTKIAIGANTASGVMSVLLQVVLEQLEDLWWMLFSVFSLLI